MSFNSAFQPILQDVGKLALSCTKVSVDAASIGIFNGAEFITEGDVIGVKTGYPLRVTDLRLNSVSAKASVGFLELGTAFKSILSGIISSLNTSVVPTHNVLLEVFRPRAENITIGMAGAALLQEFELNFGNDFNEVKLSFEQLVPAGNDITDVVTFTTLGQVTTGVTTPLLSTGNISIGLPRIEINGVTVGSIQSASLKLTTEYRRVEAGYPKSLIALTPLEHTLVLDFAMEEVSAAELDNSFVLGTATPVTFYGGLYDGTALTLTIPQARLVPASGPSLSDTDFATISKRFMATGATLLTIA